VGWSRAGSKAMKKDSVRESQSCDAPEKEAPRRGAIKAVRFAMCMTFRDRHSKQINTIEAAALDDRIWFGDHPSRQFRARIVDDRIWLVRRRRVALLRAVAPRPSALPGDTDKELAVAWYAAAFPDWSREKAQKWARRALRKGAS
jgi:hypothetical protein